MTRKFSTPVEELEYLEKLLSQEQAEDLAQYQTQVLETPLKERQRKGTSWYPVRVKNTQIGTGGKFVIELERNVEFNQPHQFQAGARQRFSGMRRQDRKHSSFPERCSQSINP